MSKRKHYSYFVKIGIGHKSVSAKEFKELSRNWEKGEEVNRIAIYSSKGVECGRRVADLQDVEEFIRNLVE